MSIRSPHELRQAEHDAMAKALADYEARGGPIERLANGVMKHNGAEVRPMGELMAEASRVRNANREDKAEKRPPGTERVPNKERLPVAPAPRKRPELAPALVEALNGLQPRDTAATLAPRLGRSQQAALQLLLRLEEKGKVIRKTSTRRRVEWIRCP